MKPSKILRPILHSVRPRLIRSNVLMFAAICTQMMFFSHAEAALICAARTYSKPDLSTYRQSIALPIQGTELLKESQRLKSNNETLFDKETAFYYSNSFSPKDIVCIADRNETEDTLRHSGIWETSGGTTVLLSPFRVNPPHTRHGPRKSNVFTRLAATTARKRFSTSGCYNAMKDWPNFSTGDRFAFQIADTLPRQECKSEIYDRRFKYRDSLLSALPRSVLGPPNLTILQTYDPKNSDSESNVVALSSFVGAVATLEALNAPFYSLPIATEEEPASPQFRVFDPVNGQRLPVTSLVNFVGNELVDMATDFLFRTHFNLIDEFESGEMPDIELLSHSRFGSADFGTFPFEIPLEQMVRGFVCRDGAGSGLRVFDLDSHSVLSGFRKVGCPSYDLDGKEVVDFTDSYQKSSKLSDKLSIVTDTQAHATIRSKLTELAEIGIGQSKTLNEVHRYVAEGVLQDRLASLNRKVAALEAQKGNFLGDLVNIGVAIGSIYTGYGGFGALVGGIKEIQGLYKGMPKGGFSEAKNYYHENRLKFSEAATVASKGMGEIVSAVNGFEGAVKSIGNLLGDRQKIADQIAEAKRAIREVENERAKLFSEIADRADFLEKQWMKTAEQLFWARQAQRSVARNVALILEDAIANNFLYSLQAEEVYEGWGRCIASLNALNVSPLGFDATPMMEACGSVDPAVDAVKNCVRENRDSAGQNVVVVGRTKAFWIGKNTEARKCYGNWIWRMENELARVH